MKSLLAFTFFFLGLTANAQYSFESKKYNITFQTSVLLEKYETESENTNKKIQRRQ